MPTFSRLESALSQVTRPQSPLCTMPSRPMPSRYDDHRESADSGSTNDRAVLVSSGDRRQKWTAQLLPMVVLCSLFSATITDTWVGLLHHAGFVSSLSHPPPSTSPKVQFLAVSGAFHSSLMAPATEALAAALAETKISMPRIKVYANTTGKPYTSMEEIRTELQKQVGTRQGLKKNKKNDNVCNGTGEHLERSGTAWYGYADAWLCLLFFLFFLRFPLFSWLW